MQNLANGADALGYLFALHENYFDAYPGTPYASLPATNPLFIGNNVALDPSGNIIPFWNNPGCHPTQPALQTSYRLAFDKSILYANVESPQIQARLRQFAIRELDLLPIYSLEEFVLQLAEDKREAWQKLKSYDADHALLAFNTNPDE